jgi:hypothetical protein
MPAIQQISGKAGKPSISGIRINSSLLKLIYDSIILPLRRVVFMKGLILFIQLEIFLNPTTLFVKVAWVFDNGSAL